MRAPVGTAKGVHRERAVLFVRVVCDGVDGWGECGALTEGTAVDPPLSSVVDLLGRTSLDRLLTDSRGVDGERVELAMPELGLGDDPAARMASAALEMALLDFELRASGRSLADFLGTGRAVEAGAVVGIPTDRELATLLRDVEDKVNRGYGRLRLKIQPDWDLEPARAVRVAHPELRLQVDANGSYGALGSRTLIVNHLTALDEFGLDCIEQPLAPDDLVSHAWLAEELATPICLDESLGSLSQLEEAISVGACQVACLKPSRLGGLQAARRAVDLCRSAGVGAFVGGFFETGLGRSANAALAGLDGFTLAGDLSNPSEYLVRDPFGYPDVIEGEVRPPAGTGVAPLPDPEILDSLTTDVRWFPAPS
jgi:O-succinylbenzoate synthase